MDLGSSDLDRMESLASEESPEHVYDREWFHELLQSVTARLQQWMEGHGKEAYFQVFAAYCLDSCEESPTYESVGNRFALSSSAVRHYLEYSRMLFRKFLKEKIRDYVVDDEEVERELREVTGE
jgi:hypothetical protein